ncbi:hypothetical protein SAMN05443637_13049 [Pseudonocardia thermophila]|jgi:hypothetical protein|uniref:Uncharacterized protein n=1 Tax=Pseudonocardia thermophila TaxID=1848 RepID=A0A1M7AWQ2_PSETH|nr:hypothetical protein [Pseudonocardia thermophila]SHL47154.1 hypothetical protein SAMN05443637_13049 [Pseudonocardia thermophila]
MTTPTLPRRDQARRARRVLAGLHPSIPVREVDGLQLGTCRGDLHAHHDAPPAAVAAIRCDLNGRRIASCAHCLVTTAHRCARATAGAIHVELPPLPHRRAAGEQDIPASDQLVGE